MRKQMTNDRSVVQITATGSFTTKANCHRTARTLRSDRKWEAQENEGDMAGGGEGGGNTARKFNKQRITARKVHKTPSPQQLLSAP